MKPLSPERRPVWPVILLVVNTVLFAAVYFVVPPLTHFAYLPQIYAAVGGTLAIWYAVYNRGFTRLSVRPEQLPPTMTEGEKEAWLAEGKRFRDRSRWALTVIIPILVTFFCDFLYLFVGQRLLEMF